MLYSPKSIANYVLDLAKARGEPISPMKLQKLVYYAHGWYAGHTGTPLINEAVEAWQYGPVIPSLYHEFKEFGADQISGKARHFDGIALCEVAPPTDAALRQFLDNIWSSYGQFTGLRLSEMTHAIGSPWEQTWRVAVGMKGVDIPFEKIKSYFQTAIQNATSQNAQN